MKRNDGQTLLEIYHSRHKVPYALNKLENCKRKILEFCKNRRLKVCRVRNIFLVANERVLFLKLQSQHLERFELVE